MPEKVISYDEASSKLKRLYKTGKLTQKQYFRLSGQLKGKYLGKPVTIKVKSNVPTFKEGEPITEDNIEEVIQFFGKPLEEL